MAQGHKRVTVNVAGGSILTREHKIFNIFGIVCGGNHVPSGDPNARLPCLFHKKKNKKKQNKIMILKFCEVGFFATSRLFPRNRQREPDTIIFLKCYIHTEKRNT